MKTTGKYNLPAFTQPAPKMVQGKFEKVNGEYVPLRHVDFIPRGEPITRENYHLSQVRNLKKALEAKEKEDLHVS